MWKITLLSVICITYLLYLCRNFEPLIMNASCLHVMPSQRHEQLGQRPNVMSCPWLNYHVLL